MADGKGSCPYNDWLACMPHGMRCKKCGWNPKVAEKRLKKLRNEEDDQEEEK